MNILGISAYYHDSAAAIVQDGQVRLLDTVPRRPWFSKLRDRRPLKMG